MSSTLPVVTILSGGSEFLGIVKGDCEGLFMRNVIACLGQLVKVRFHSDSSAGRTIAKHLGTGRRVQHIHTQFLFPQD